MRKWSKTARRGCTPLRIPPPAARDVTKGTLMNESNRGAIPSPASPKWRELVPVSVAIALLLMVFFPEASLQGRVIASTNFRRGDPVYAGAAWAETRFDFMDPSPEIVNLPFTVFQGRSFRKSAAPLWNPYNGCGAPLLADGQSSPFYPLKLMSYIPRDPLRLYSLYLLANLFIAGVSTYWYCRIMGLRSFAAYFSSISYMLGGALMVRLEFYDFPPAALFPVLMIGLENLARKPSSVWIVGVGLLGALQVSSGHALGMFALSLFALIYYLVRVMELKGVRGVGRGVLALVVAVGMAGAVCSALIIPLVELLSQGLSPRQFPESHRYLYMVAKSFRQFGLKTLVGVFLPHLHSAWGVGLMPEARSIAWSYVSYSGVLAPVLAAYGAARGVARRAPVLMVVFGSAFLFCLAPLGLLVRLPVMREITPWYAAPGFSFALVVLAGLGLERLGSVRGRSDKMVTFIIVIVLVVLFNAVVVFGPAANFLEAQRDELSVMLISALILIGFWLVHVGGVRHRRGGTVLCVAAVALAFCDLYLNGSWLHPTQRPGEVYPVSPAIGFLKSQSGLFRVSALVDDHRNEYIFGENLGMVYEIYQLPLCDNVAAKRYVYFMSLLGAPVDQAWHTPVKDSPLLDVANVRYVLRAYDKPLPESDRYEERFSDGFVRIYENMRAVPRAFLVHDAKPVSSPEEALLALKDEAASLSHKAIVELDRGRVPPFSVSGESGVEEERVTVREYAAQRVTIDVLLEKPGLLVLSDTYYPGWKAYVDGRRREIVPTNLVMRGVFLPAGEHEVVFVYAPLSYRVGLALSVLAIVGCVVFAIVRTRHGRGRLSAGGRGSIS